MLHAMPMIVYRVTLEMPPMPFFAAAAYATLLA